MRCAKLKRTQILLAADTGTIDEEIARSVSVGRSADVPDRAFPSFQPTRCGASIPEITARKLVEIASTIEPVQNGRINNRAGQLAIPEGWRQSRRVPRGPQSRVVNGWLVWHESDTYVKFTEAGAALFAWRKWGRPMPLKSGRPLPTTSNCPTPVE